MSEMISNNRPPWAQPGGRTILVLLDNWRSILSATLGTMVVAVVVALLLPKTYRASCTILVALPRYVENLKLPPPPVDMTTVHTLATSTTILQAIPPLVEKQRDLVARAKEKLGDQAWSKIGAMDATAAASLLGQDFNEEFKTAWEDLPPDYLLPGYLEFEEDAFARVDPLVLIRALEAMIKTSVETNTTTEYQPLLTLSAEWDTERTAAVLSHCWAKILLRAVKRDITEPVLADQAQRLRQVVETGDQLKDAVSKLQELEAKELLAIKTQERDATLKDLYTGWSDVPSLLSQRDDLEREIVATVEQLANLRALVGDLEWKGAWIGGLGEAVIREITQSDEKREVADVDLLRANRQRLGELDAFNTPLRLSILSAEKSPDVVWEPPFPPEHVHGIADLMRGTWTANRGFIGSTTADIRISAADISSLTAAKEFSTGVRKTLSLLQAVLDRQEAFQKTLSAKRRLIESEAELYAARKSNQIEQLEADLKVYTERLDAATRSESVLLGQPGITENSPEILRLREYIQDLAVKRAKAEDGLAAAKLLIGRLESQRKLAEALLDERKTYYIEQVVALSKLSKVHQNNRDKLRAIERSIERRERRADMLNADVLDILARKANLELERDKLTKMHNFTLEQIGGVEALSTNYSNALRVSLLSPPAPPKRKVAPRRSLIVLLAGFLACLIACGWYLLTDQYHRLRAAQPM
ncbi:MAG: hypothetical protein HUU16_01940 [Candidatus Omnitrophica bacterium]|nr:hypothetical protein [Candidatus Omnitrophota bacterium]